MSYAEHFSRRATPQSEQADPKQVANSAGGFSFQVDKWGRLDRFLILGSEGGSYYATERKLTRENATVVDACLNEDSSRAVLRIAEISQSGRAPKNSPAIFALAMAAGHPNPLARKQALAALPRVCRIGTHLFEFVDTVQHMRGWGRGLRRALGAWYTEREPERLAYQLIKYRQRHGWSHRDVLRVAHPKAKAAAIDGLLGYAVKGMPAGYLTENEHGWTHHATAPDALGETASDETLLPLPALIYAFEAAQKSDTPKQSAALIREHGLTHEMVPTGHLKDPGVWAALLERMPMGAMVRNLGRMSSLGLVAPLSEAAKTVCERLADVERLRKSRLHPMSILTAQMIYAQGRGMRGSLEWTPVPQVVDALDAAFYAAFGNVTPSGKAHLLALDVSASMTWSTVAGSPLTPRMASAALALVTANVEPNYHVMAFSGELVPINLSAGMRLSDAVRAIESCRAGRTDCSLPMTTAQAKGWGVDGFCVYTDNETWAGQIHPHQSLVRYRQAAGREAKLVVCGMVANDFTIADPNDPGMLDVVGFDTSTPAIIADFVGGG